MQYWPEHLQNFVDNVKVFAKLHLPVVANSSIDIQLMHHLLDGLWCGVRQLTGDETLPIAFVLRKKFSV